MPTVAYFNLPIEGSHRGPNKTLTDQPCQCPEELIVRSFEMDSILRVSVIEYFILKLSRNSLRPYCTTNLLHDMTWIDAEFWNI